MPKGTLAIQHLRYVMRTGLIKGVPQSQLNPGSLDLPLSSEAYRLEKTFLPLGKSVREKIKAAGGVRYDLHNPLDVGVSYLIRIEGSFRFPRSVYGYSNPKSSTGRLNVLVRMMGDGAWMYDAFKTPGWSGEIWALVEAKSFPVRVHPGTALSQLRLFDGKSFMDQFELDIAIEEYGLLFHPNGRRFTAKELDEHTHADSFLLSIGIPKGVAGWECRGCASVLDTGKNDFYRPEKFFVPVRAQDGRLDLKKGSFYILTTYEHLVVPPGCAAELRAIDPRFGDFRAHSAGFFDPGWGLDKEGRPRGQPITLEIAPHEDLYFEPGQIVGRVRYERMKETPLVLYSSSKRSHYTKQLRGAKLSKHFKK